MVNFTRGELEVMQVLWDRGPLNPQQLEENYPRPIRNAALRSVLLVLLEKGHIEREKVGRAYVYRARTPRQGTLRKMIRQVADVFCGGSPKALIAYLIENEKLSSEDMRELQRIAAERSDEKTGESVQHTPVKKNLSRGQRSKE